jgi:hypothetical protein
MIKLASSIDEGRARGTELGPEAAAARLVRHLSTKAAENDLGAVVSFFSNALGLAREAMDGVERTHARPAEPARGDTIGQAAALTCEGQSDPSYWLG